MWAAGGKPTRKQSKFWLYEGTIDPKIHSIITNLDQLKSNPTLFSAQVHRKQTSRRVLPIMPGSVEALLLAAHMLSTMIPAKKRKYAQRKPKEEDPTAPLCPGCPYGCRRIKKSDTTSKPTCRKCKADKKNGRTSRHSLSTSEEDVAAESSQQRGTAAGTSASMLRRSSGDIVSESPRPNRPGRMPHGHALNGKEYPADNPTAPQNVDRRTHPRAGHGLSTLQAGWKTDLQCQWMRREKDTEPMAATAGRCVTELLAADCEECVGCHQCRRMYCKDCRSRTVNTFSADIGCHIFKRVELARHLRIFQVGSGSVQTMLSKRLKRIRIRTILAVVFLAVEKIVLLKLPVCFSSESDSESDLGPVRAVLLGPGLAGLAA